MDIRIVVTPGVTEIGIVSKDDRGLVAEEGNMPASLAGMNASLLRVSTSLGVSLEQSAPKMKESFEKALSRYTEMARGPDVSGPSWDGPSM